MEISAKILQLPKICLEKIRCQNNFNPNGVEIFTKESLFKPGIYILDYLISQESRKVDFALLKINKTQYKSTSYPYPKRI